MTLILSIGNVDQVIQISDRRLSKHQKVVTDDSNKATVFICRNGRFAVGYTGIAISPHKGFRTQRWLIDSFMDCAAPDYAIYEISERFEKKASRDFKYIPFLRSLAPSEKRLSIMLSGYLTHGSRPLIANITITNFQDFQSGQDYPEAKDEFWTIYELEQDDLKLDTTFIQRVGAWRAMTSEDERILRNMLGQRKPQKALINRAVNLVRQMSDRPAAGNTVGKHLIVTIIPSDSVIPCSAIVKPINAADKVILADEIVLLGREESIAIRDIELSVSPSIEGTPAIIPRLGRNDPCWCMSGKKYKWCHGR
ncbi:hypothetical protein LEP3755_13360 [Leptolyngbya sp. NIES-3755]|nr:hypothetical protein LEP3755_13360 [Leptolyngbya sp. NIES-3755]